jgi:hypothetical protein
MTETIFMELDTCIISPTLKPPKLYCFTDFIKPTYLSFLSACIRS